MDSATDLAGPGLLSPAPSQRPGPALQEGMQEQREHQKESSISESILFNFNNELITQV